MKDNYFDNPNTDEDRKVRAKKKKKSSAGKVFFIILGMIIIALAAFVGTIKVVSPDFDIKGFVIQKVSSVIEKTTEAETTVPVTEPSDVSETTTETTTVTTTEPTTYSPVEYLPIEDFKVSEAKKGNQLGNILNGGYVGCDMSYVYHIVNGDGIYRFEPQTESYSRIYKTADKLSSLNLRGVYLYFVNNRDNKLYRLEKTSQKAKAIAENVKTAYVYDNRVYYVTKDNRLCCMKTDKLNETELYNSVDENMTLLGVSLKRVFFTLDNVYGGMKYMTVDIEGKEKAQEFREPSSVGTVLRPVMENGYLYSYVLNEKGNYSLVRQKYGSQKTATLIKKVSNTSVYPVVDRNRLFYSALKDGRFDFMELNMNSGKTKIMLSQGGVAKSNNLVIQHGEGYDFIIGKRNTEGKGKKVYAASGIYTGSTNVMRFKDGEWSY